MHTNARINQALLRKVRAHLGLTFVDVAYMSKLSLRTVMTLESGDNPNPTLDTLNSIAKTYGCEVTQLLLPNSYTDSGRYNVELIRNSLLNNPES